MLGPLEMVIFIAILGGVIAGLLVLVLRGIPLLIKYLINPKVKKEPTIKKEPRSSKIFNKINFRSYGLKEWAFISIIVFVSFFFLEKIYTNFAKDIFYDASYSITNFIEDIPDKYTEFKRHNEYKKLVSTTAKKLDISKEEVNRFKRIENMRFSEIKTKLSKVEKSILLFEKSLMDFYPKDIDSEISTEKRRINSRYFEAVKECKTLFNLPPLQRCMKKYERYDKSKCIGGFFSMCKEEIIKCQSKEKVKTENEIKESLSACERKAKRNKESSLFKLNILTEKLKCLQSTKIPNIFNYSNLEKYKNDFGNIPEC